MRLTNEQLGELLEREAVRKRNPELSNAPSRAGQAPVMEPDSRDGTLATTQIQAPDTARFRVCVISVRKRLLDEDNLCEKYIVDLCRYAGLIPDDCPGQTKIEVSQRKCADGEIEHVDVTIEKIEEP